jgi:ribokinase
MVRVAIAGSANTDLVARLPRLPKRGETLIASSYMQAGGGKGANQAIAARRMGAEVIFIGAVGRDAYGTATRDCMRSEGIDTTYLLEKDVHSGVALIFVEEGTGENMIAVASGANYALTPEDIRKAENAIATADVLLVQMELRPEATLEAVKIAGGHGKPVIYNPAPAPSAEVFRELLPFLAYITPNIHELEIITGGKKKSTAIKELFKAGVKGVFVTLGAKGAALHTPGEKELKVDAFPVKAVDTVGAGDAFNGALAVLIAEGKSLPDALRGAVAAGAIAVTKQGAQPSMPRRKEVEQLLAGR